LLYQKTLVIGAFLCAILILCGCSGNGTVMVPDPLDNQPVDAVSDGLREGTEFRTTHMLWGMYDIHLDMNNWTVSTTIAREAQWHWDITAFLIPPFCPDNDCLVIDNFGPWDLPMTAQFDGIIKHPFPGDSFFDGFDVRTIGVLSSTYPFPSGDVAVQVILNPDGFTNVWNVSPYVPNSDINAYKAYWTKSEMRRFENGKTDSRNFIVMFPESGYLDFAIAVDASYEFPDLVVPGDPATSPNIWEPYEVTASLAAEIMETPGSEALLQITVYDWQDNPGPVSIEAPDLFNGTIDAGPWISSPEDYTFEYEVIVTNTNGAEPGLHPLLISCVDSFDASVPELDLIAYNILMINVMPYIGPLPPVAVAYANKPEAYPGEEITFNATDSFDPDGSISTYEWDLVFNGSYDDADGPVINHFYTELGQKTIDVRVTDLDGLTDTLDEKIHVNIIPFPNDPPVAVASANIQNIPVGGTVLFKGEDSYDPDGEISTYSWDLDGDSHFGDPIKNEDQMNPSYQYNTEETYFVWLRVQDDYGTWDQTNFPITIECAGENVDPIASGEVNCDNPQTNKPIVFTSTATDPDGFIIKWEWDFGDGWEDFTSTEGTASHTFIDADTYYVDHRVTDIVGAPDTLDTLMEIIVEVPDFVVPDPYDCSSAENTHTYQQDFKLTNVNHGQTYDICTTPDGHWLLGTMGKLAVLDVWGTTVDANFHTLIGTGPFLFSLDSDPVNGNYAYIYDDIPYSSTIIQIISSTGSSVASIDMTETAPLAVCFDWAGNLWVLTNAWETRMFIADQGFAEDPCLGYEIENITGGRIYDMAFDFYNHSLYIFSQGSDGYGRLDKYNVDGTLADTKEQIFDSLAVGYSNHGDIIIDNSSGDGASDCRIELFSGEMVGAVARFDSELNEIGSSIFSFWGCKAAGHDPLTGTVIVLEVCCGRYFDRYLPPADW